MNERTSAILRVACMSLALPDTTVTPAHGAPAYRIRGKSFCTVIDNHHGNGRVELWVKGAPGAQQEWMQTDSQRYYVPPYVGPTGWIGAWLDGDVDWPVIAEMLVDGYLLQAGARASAALNPARLMTVVLAAT